MTVRVGRSFGFAACLLSVAAAAGAASADDKIPNPIAVFSGLDKITGRIISFDVYIDETVQFGALRVTPRVCYTRPMTEASRTDGFVEVDEITLDNQIQRIFTGWMFAASPGLNAVDHAIYDVWLTDCRLASDVPPPEGFDMAKYAQEGLGVIERPEGWQPVPLPRPAVGATVPGAAPVEGETPPVETPSDVPED